MKSRRWLIIPVAMVMYTISCVDRTNLSMVLTNDISTMVKDLGMDDRMIGRSFGIFFLGYVMLQIPGGHWASRWSARKLISLCLIGWGIGAVGCGLVQSFRQFEAARFLLGAAESAVFPAMLVLLADWFPRSERAQANAGWNLCQPLAVVVAALTTGVLLGHYNWRIVIVLEGALPFLWLPLWWFFIRDRPREAKWISAEERDYLETTLAREAAAVEPARKPSLGRDFCRPLVLLMIVIYFFHNCLVYGCMTFFTSTLHNEELKFKAWQYGILFALPYALTAVLMMLVSRHSDKVNERRMHVAVTYFISGLCLIISMTLHTHFKMSPLAHFWWAYAFLCLSIPGPSVVLGPFWSIASEALPVSTRGAVMGLINACGNLGGYYGPSIVGLLKHKTGSLEIPFDALGIGILIAAGLSLLLPKAAPIQRT